MNSKIIFQDGALAADGNADKASYDLAQVLRASQLVVWEWDVARDVWTICAQGAVQWGWASDTGQSHVNLLDLVLPDDQALLRAAGQNALAQRGPCHCEFRITRSDGAVLWLSALGEAIHDDNGGQPVFIGTVRDITQRKKEEAKQALAAQVFENTLEGVLITDAEMVILAANPAFSHITGYSEAEILGKTPRVLKSGRHEARFYEEMRESLRRYGQWRGEIWNRRKFGEIYPELLTISSVRDGQGRVTHYVAVFSDITSSKAIQENLDFLAHHDPLTSLPNRMLFRARLEHSLQQADRDGCRRAVLYVDLDRFKRVNDTLGHPAGDELLQAVAKAMAQVVRQGDTLARLGGDEFVLLTEGLKEPQDAASVARKLLDVFAEPFEVRGHALYITASIGIALYPDDGRDADTLVANADVSLYQAKALGRNAYQFFEPKMSAGALERLELENELRGALARQELEVYYQPQVYLPTGEIEGAEALLRWRHPQRGFVSPVEFIPLAEEMGLIAEIGAWVLRQACQQLVAWDAQGVYVRRVAVNLSVQQLERPVLVGKVEQILAETGISAERIELEVTESMIMREADQAIDTMNGLRELGVKLAVDDFGTGYSSLAYLKKLPLHRLKIDRTFVRDLTSDPNDAAIARAIIAMGQSLGLLVLAEGVENRDQAEFLSGEGCHEVQGYYFGRPVPAHEFAQLFIDKRLVR